MSSSVVTVESALSDAAQKLMAASESPALDAKLLLAWVLDAPQGFLLMHPEAILDSEAAHDFADAVARRCRGEPAAYITGMREFWSLPLKVSRDTLVPRPDTETLVEQALRLIPPEGACRVLDLGTGSGAIAVAIASERPKCAIDAIDSSPAALIVARENAALHDLENICFLQGDWTKPVAGRTFDVIVSNPPYVREDDPALDSLKFEPRAALAAGSDGMDAIRTIAREARTVAATNGFLLLEHGSDQRDAVADTLKQNGWADISCITDLAGHPRVTRARMGEIPNRNEPCSLS